MFGLPLSTPTCQPTSGNRYLKIQLGGAIIDSGDLSFFEQMKFIWTGRNEQYCLALAEDRIAKGGVWQKRYEGLTAVSAKSIEMQAQLIQVIRRGKIWALGQSDMQPMGKTVNDVYQLEENGEIIGYLKLGVRGSPAVGMMEKLVWGVANWLGFQESFAPTEIARFTTAKKNEMNGPANISVWNGGELEFKEITSLEALCGSAQVAQKGKGLYQFTDRGSLSKREVVEGILVSVVLGMSDAHQKNIIVTDEGKIKFYDNTRSLRHSNGYIKHSEIHVRTAYRCALLDLPASKTPLTAGEIADLKKRTFELRRKVETLQADYFKFNKVKLPSDWMDKEVMLSAMKERVERIEAGLNKGVIKTARDLVLRVYPDYKFVFALTFAHLHLNKLKYSVDHLHHDQGYFDMGVLLGNTIDLRQVKQWCNDDISLEDLVLKIKAGIDNETLKTSCDEAFNEEERREIFSRAVVDRKDTFVIE